ncbi:PD-(D/E)XK nuclease family protein [Mucilaginibacter ginsenosidivorax]|uniref:Nuclease n=1 Tax=Mucilaginibacter ginsenosidivorax TaxID=862126 RepID=A0A5B8W7M3_9SPHI|nr:PD-(D/E)XK nuclease family protein [Mucilaginibacter ginsenosidivorax]QEC79711.1 nuclease [Mucilaginibacter ginsenosidivorax]
MKPNIFDLATKELSQDAFLTWLLSYADPANAAYDSKLNQCAQQLVNELISTHVNNFDGIITTVRAGRQWNNVDVWVEVNNTYFIIIEDKTTTGQHSNQLTRYKEIATDWCLQNNYTSPVCVYIKTGNESLHSLRHVKEAGFSIYNRKHLVKLLNSHPEITNDIFTDFKQRLLRLEAENNQFLTKVLGDWGGVDWQGFFQYIEREMSIVAWNYVNNPAGGFWCAVLNWDYWNDLYPVYVQLEEGKLCFKISTDPEEPVEMPPNVSRGQIRNELHAMLMQKAKDNDVKNIRKPDRFGSGNYMTVAIVDKHNWLGSKDSIINPAEVINTLTLYRSFLKKAIQ